MGPFKKTWSDQPDVVTSMRPLARTFTVSTSEGPKIVEVRESALGRFVSFGNLFGSETIRCPDDKSVYALLAELGKDKPKLPVGCEVVRNSATQAT